MSSGATPGREHNPPPGGGRGSGDRSWRQNPSSMAMHQPPTQQTGLPQPAMAMQQLAPQTGLVLPSQAGHIHSTSIARLLSNMCTQRRRRTHVYSTKLPFKSVRRYFNGTEVFSVSQKTHINPNCGTRIIFSCLGRCSRKKIYGRSRAWSARWILLLPSQSQPSRRLGLGPNRNKIATKVVKKSLAGIDSSHFPKEEEAGQELREAVYWEVSNSQRTNHPIPTFGLNEAPAIWSIRC